MPKLARILLFLAALLLFNTTPVRADFEVPVGGIAIVGFNFDGTQEFSFVCTTSIPAGTEIRFTDKGWTSAGAFRTGEGFISWYTPGGCSIGQIVNIKPSEWPDFITDDFTLSTSGDQILVYQFLSGVNHFVFALNSEGTGWQLTASDAFTSALPTGLDSSNSIALQEIDNAVYTGSKTFNSVSEGLASLVNIIHWAGSDTTRQTMPTGTFSFGTTAVQVSSFTAKIATQPFQIILIAVPLFLVALFFLRKYLFIKAHN
jgi:hypothetical protein